MKVIVYEKYGGPEVLHEVTVPTPQPGPREILVRVMATSVTTADWRLRSMILPRGFGLLGRVAMGLFGPRQKVLGTELSGVVEKVGAEVTRFRVNDAVIAQVGAKLGCYAEYKLFAEDAVLARKPDNVSFEEAATVSFGFSTAWDYLVQRAVTKPGQKVLIYGASGSVGSAAVQVAKLCGAEVTAVCSQKSADFVRSLGADYILDYQSPDFRVPEACYDSVMDVLGVLSLQQGSKYLRTNGKFLMISADLVEMLFGLVLNVFSAKKYVFGPVAEDQVVLDKIVEMLGQKKIRSCVDRVFDLSEIQRAHEYVDQRRRLGNIAVRIKNS